MRLLSMRGGSVLILVYHSINTTTEDRIRLPNLVSPTHFDDQMHFLASSATVIGLDEVLAYMNTGGALPKNAVVVTFDDGYRDNLSHALPVLQKYDLPATFFLATDYIDSGKMKWEDRLSYVIRHGAADPLNKQFAAYPGVATIREKADKFKLVNRLVNDYGHADHVERDQWIDGLYAALGVDAPDTTDLMLTWDDVRQLAGTPGMSIGAHTVTHRHLTRIPVDDLDGEIAGSKRHIEDEIDQPVTLFSYPYGDVNDQVVTAVRASGFSCAGTINYGRNRIDSDLFLLKRVLVPDQSGLQFRVGLALRGSILGETLKKSYNLVNRMTV